MTIEIVDVPIDSMVIFHSCQHFCRMPRIRHGVMFGSHTCHLAFRAKTTSLDDGNCDQPMVAGLQFQVAEPFVNGCVCKKGRHNS